MTWIVGMLLRSAAITPALKMKLGPRPFHIIIGSELNSIFRDMYSLM
jgi:hypothetical protein